ncbi:hypothetical protein V8C35DRAFT_248395 [Trichoderma chlorosporum]
MAGVVVGGFSTSTSFSSLPSQGVDPNPDNGPGVGSGGPAGGPGGGVGSNTNTEAQSLPTPTSSVPMLPPAASSTSSSTALASPTVIVFDDAANFGTDPRGRVFFTSNRTKLFSWRIGNATTTPLDIYWYGRPVDTGEPFDITQAHVIASAKFGDSSPGNEFVSLNLSNTTLNLTGSALTLSDWYQKQMVIKIDWETRIGDRGFTQSGVFTVANSTRSIDAEAFGSSEATDNEQDALGGEAVTSVGNPTLPTGGPSGGNGVGGGSNGDNTGASSVGSGGLSKGAIAGIAVACSVVGILVIGGLAWFFLRRRRRRHFDQGYNAAGQRTTSFIATKEVQPSVAESPIGSPFSDDGPGTRSMNAMLPLQTTAAGTSAARMAPTHGNESDRPDTAASGNNNMSRNIAHLVEEGMTEADILRLEEEERHLDAEIERAARRTSS